MRHDNDNARDTYAIHVQRRPDSYFQSEAFETVELKAPLDNRATSYTLERLCAAYPLLKFRKVRNGKPGPWLNQAYYARQQERRAERLRRG